MNALIVVTVGLGLAGQLACAVRARLQAERAEMFADEAARHRRAAEAAALAAGERAAAAAFEARKAQR